ncbi:MAG TPA: sulfite exporter TauE/SafE family protein [Candidatus Aquicultor sp.]|jgi:hypothetical protein
MSFIDIIGPILIGFFAGYLSGQFGVGGGVLMTPALRLILGTPALVAVGTPVPVIIVSAVTGAATYYRNGYVDLRLARDLAITGMIGAALGAYTTRFVNGDIILLITAAVFIFIALNYITGRGESAVIWERFTAARSHAVITSALIGMFVGFYSGFLGLGGGFLLVPALTIIFGKDIKTAFGTSLVVIIAYAIPGTIVHFLLGHIQPLLVLLLSIGIIPGAALGSRIAIGLPEATLRRMFGFLLLVIALYFGIAEIRQLFA